MVKSLFNKWISSSLSFNFIVFHVIMALCVLVLSILVCLQYVVFDLATENYSWSWFMLLFYAIVPVSFMTTLVFLFNRFRGKSCLLKKPFFLLFLLILYVLLSIGLYFLFQFEESGASTLYFILFSIQLGVCFLISFVIPLLSFIIFDIFKFIRFRSQ